MTDILVIDDDPDILEAIKAILEYRGYGVKTSVQAEHAEKLLKPTTGSLPSLIILDVLLSGKDGRIVCKKLKGDSKTKQIPVLMISAHPDIDKSVKEVGANDFIAKPFDMDEFLSRVDNLLNK